MPSHHATRAGRSVRRTPRVEALESRIALSLLIGAEGTASFPSDHDHDHDHEVEVGPQPESADARGAGPQIRLDLVALHEFGHALGLPHNDSTAPGSIMNAYYNANYNLANFSSDAAVTTLKANYTNLGYGWKNSLDGNAGNNTVDLTYSFVQDGARMDKGSSSLLSAFNALFPGKDWKKVLGDELKRWGTATSKFTFTERTETAVYASGVTGAIQNDPRFGDIRIGGHSFDNAGKVLAHTYYPPPTNSGTISGDAHFDVAENWVLPAGATAASQLTTGSTAITGTASSGSSFGHHAAIVDAAIADRAGSILDGLILNVVLPEASAADTDTLASFLTTKSKARKALA